MRRSCRVGVRRLLHLICLRCGRANAADAKFCGECGGALLRKFCAECHAVNDAESHFCRSCGAALPAQPPTPATVPTAATTPDTIEVAHAERAEAHFVTPTTLPLSSIVEVPPQWPAPPQTGLAPRMHALAYRPSLLLGFTGAAAALLVFASWPRFDHTRASSGEQPSAPATSHANAAAKAGPASLAPASVTPAEIPAPATAAAPANIDSARIDAAASPTPIAAMPRAEGRAPSDRRPTPEATLAAHPPAAGPPRVQPERTGPTRRSPPAPAPECTPQVDALGLCAPGAKVIGR